MDDFLWQVREESRNSLLSGLRFAVFGCGDASQWPDNFADAIDEVYTTMAQAGGQPVGHWRPVRGEEYLNSRSKSFREDGHYYVGLPLDNINQSHLTRSRISSWCLQLSEEFSLKGDVQRLTSSDPFNMSEDSRLASNYTYPRSRVPRWSTSNERYHLFGSRLTANWYQFGSGEGSAGRWLKFTDDSVLMRAGLRGQPEYQLSYSAITGFRLDPLSGTESVTLVLFLEDKQRLTGRPWSKQLVLKGLPRSDVPGFCSFLKERGAALH
eukprot:CAMPEP_0177610440 /NCGR_PEP_ID=MMETSP0419_2-20121207/19780_1 /TAXON_ID=582737 /ORGANISM="Tetraselmis sp., Strain GSL018" /LENGTH=266 /DNA_ID=CAMNT_0019105745 /DNA_START=401 /DNA_END=1201 /DNA_ORIENTATION=-